MRGRSGAHEAGRAQHCVLPCLPEIALKKRPGALKEKSREHPGKKKRLHAFALYPGLLPGWPCRVAFHSLAYGRTRPQKPAKKNDARACRTDAENTARPCFFQPARTQPRFLQPVPFLQRKKVYGHVQIGKKVFQWPKPGNFLRSQAHEHVGMFALPPN